MVPTYLPTYYIIINEFIRLKPYGFQNCKIHIFIYIGDML